MARELVWSEATVERGTLSVQLTPSDDPDWAWAEAFDSVNGWMSRETRGGIWGAAVLTPDGIMVEEVVEGSEAALRQFLDSVVRQTEQELGRRSAEVSQTHQRMIDNLTAQKEADQRMTELFRGEPSGGPQREDRGERHQDL
jgi:hypothetical protein